jgi:hypothetical protein
MNSPRLERMRRRSVFTDCRGSLADHALYDIRLVGRLVRNSLGFARLGERFLAALLLECLDRGLDRLAYLRTQRLLRSRTGNPRSQQQSGKDYQ